jgi:hypothetical protein
LSGSLGIEQWRRKKLIKQKWCRRWDSNPRPKDYETFALPLSYTGQVKGIHSKEWCLEVSSGLKLRRSNPPLGLLLPNFNLRLRALSIQVIVPANFLKT